MGDYIPNKIRCKNCKWFKSIDFGDKTVGFCTGYGEPPLFVRPNMQIGYGICFEEKD